PAVGAQHHAGGFGVQGQAQGGVVGLDGAQDTVDGGGGGRRNGVSEGVDVGGEGGGRGGQGAALPGGAPLLEGGPVAAVGGTGVGGPAVGDARGRGRAQLLVGAGDGM